MKKFDVKSSFDIKDVDEKQGIITGYAAIFDVKDTDDDIIVPGAFKKTLKERGVGSNRLRIKHLWQHDSWQPIGIPIVLEEHEKGLYFESKIGRDRFSQDKLQQHIDKIITEMSIGFRTIQSETINNDNGEFDHRILKELFLWEYSSVTWGAMSLTEITSAKMDGNVIDNLQTRLSNLSRGLKNTKYTDETLESFEAEISKIQTIIKSLIQPEKSTDEPIIDNLKIILKAFENGKRI